MRRFGVELLLIAFSVITSIGFIVTYTVSVALDHVTPDLPYISDTGGQPPESCIFSLVCNVAILVELLVVFIRFKHIQTDYTNDVATLCVPMKVINYSALVIGLASAFGFLLVANFQNDYVPSVHFFGAFVVFFAGLIYQWVQTYMSFRIYRSGLANHISVCWVIAQMIICVLSLVFFLGATIFAVLASSRHVLDRNHVEGTFHWSPGDGGFVFHVISTACEWGMSFTLLLFFVTFHPDFSQIRLDITVRRRSEVPTYETIVNESTPLTI